MPHQYMYPLEVVNIENPTTVDYAEGNLIFQLIDPEQAEIKTENFQGQYFSQHQIQQQLQQHQQEPEEGKVIMSNLTGFGGPVINNIGMQGNMDFSKVSVSILEQPASHKLRFRYECEGRSAGALQGVSSTSDNKTYPTIKIEGYQGPAVVVVSCVEEKAPYRAHPHNLVGRGTICRKGVCSMDINNQDMTCQFANLGIQCVRKKDAPASLVRREEIRVDPFKQGFSHKNSAINLNAIRLCFQVFLKINGKLHALQPVVSNVIYDKKSHSDLQIIEVSDDTSPVEGGKKLMLFCEKVDKNDIEVHFTHSTKTGQNFLLKGDFTSSDVHKQYGIVLKTPSLLKNNIHITQQTIFAMYLFKPSDQSASEPVDFIYLPPTIKTSPIEDNKAWAEGLALGSPASKPASQKRGREPKQCSSPHEQSSGQIIVPPKQPPSKYRDGGGQVTIVDPVDIKPPIQAQADEAKIPGMAWNQSEFYTPPAMMPPTMAAPRGASYNPAMGRNNLDAPGQAQQAAAGQQLPEMNTSEIVAVAAAVAENFPDLVLNSSDLMVDNLSSNISDMKLDKRASRNSEFSMPSMHHQQHQQQQQHHHPSNSNQLNTPDVSMDEILRSGSMKRNNLNKF